MKKQTTYTLLIGSLLSIGLQAQNTHNDSARIAKYYTIDEVVVTGTRSETDIRHLPMTVSVIDRRQIEQRYEPSLLPTLTEQVPGLFTTGRGMMGYGVSAGAAGGMSLRGIGGSPTTGLLVLIDGHPQYMGLMGHPIADAYQAMLTDRVEIVRGPASVLYGSNAMGGVINIVTRRQQTDGVMSNVRVGYGSYNTLTTEASNLIRKGRFSSIVTASYNRTNGHRKDMEFEQYGGYTKLGYEFSEIWNAFADVNLTHFNASNPGTITAPRLDNDSRVTRGVTSLSIENKYERTSGALKLFYNWGRHKINDGYLTGKDPLDYRFNSKDLMLGLSWYQSATLFTGNRVTAGIDYQHFGGEAWNKYLNGERKTTVDKSENEVAGYLEMRQSLGELLTLNAGVRIDHHSVTGTEWIPQGGLVMHLPHHAELKAMVSKGFRNPTIRELYMINRNPELLPERLMNYELSYSQHLLEHSLLYGINLFYINGNNQIQTLPVNSTPTNVNIGKIENWGVEANISYRLNASWVVSGNYSWLHMVHPVVAAPEHKLYVGIDYTHRRWSASTGIQSINGLYTSVKPKESKENFVLWNVRGSYRLCHHVDIFVKGDNLLAQQYEINAGFPMPKVTFMGGFNVNF